MHRIGEEELQGPPLALRLLLQTRYQAPEPGYNLWLATIRQRRHLLGILLALRQYLKN